MLSGGRVGFFRVSSATRLLDSRSPAPAAMDPMAGAGLAAGGAVPAPARVDPVGQRLKGHP